ASLRALRHFSSHRYRALPELHSFPTRRSSDLNEALNYPGRDGFGYTVFGKVVQGQEVVDKIKGVLVDDKGMFQNIPVIPIVIKRSEEHTSELQSLRHLVCRLLLEKKKKKTTNE